jgi:release factor glutamine methyltransferase
MSFSIGQALNMSLTLKPYSESYLLDTEMILGFIVSKTREYLRANEDENLTEIQMNQFKRMLCKRKQGMPVAYIVGKRFFWDFELKVNKSVLIPRPETELLVEFALKAIRSLNRAERIADLGTGSGAIAIALARENPKCSVHAVDISSDALEVARTNARNLGVSNIIFHEGSWCDGLPDLNFDLIVANPPYISDSDSHLNEKGLQYEPRLALAAENLGYSELNLIIRDSRKFLKKDSWLLLEHGYNQQKLLIKELNRFGYSDILGLKDYADIDRMVAARWKAIDN